MRLDVSKTNVIHFHGKRRPLLGTPRVMFGELEVQILLAIRYLGFHLDEILDHSAHADYLSRRLRPWVALLYRLRDRVPQRCLLDMYFGMIYSEVLYLIEGWGVASKKWISVIQVLQNKPIRAIYQWHNRAPRMQMCMTAIPSILSVQALYENVVAKYTFEVVHQLTHSNIESAPARGNTAQRHRRLHIERTRTMSGGYGDKDI